MLSIRGLRVENIAATIANRKLKRNTSSNWHYSDFDKTYFEDKNDLATYLHWDWSIVNYVKKTISKYSLDKYSDQFTLYGGVFYNKTNPATGLPYYVEETEEVEAA